MSGNDIANLSATQLIEEYRAKRLSPVEATEAAYGQIQAYDDKINAFCHLAEESAMANAKASEARWAKGEPAGLIDGVPTSIKDLVIVKDWPTRRGSLTTSPDDKAAEDAPSVERLRQHGAVLIGKTTTPEFGYKGVSDSPLTGITRNPWDLEMTTGGSSSGAAAAVVMGMGPLAIGSDGGGSIRIPCGFTGLFGLKGSGGRVPAYPISPFGSLAHVGPMTRTVADSALMMNVMAGWDARDYYALPSDGQDFAADLEAGVKGLKVAFSMTLGYAKVDGEVADCVAAAVKVFSDLGAEVVEVDPDIGDPTPAFWTHWSTGAANLLRNFTPEQIEKIEPGLVEIARQGAEVPLMDYLAAVTARRELGVRMNAFHQTYDLLLTPTLATTAFPVGLVVPEHMKDETWAAWTPFTYPFNMTRQPAANVPCGFTDEGLPVGLHIVGPMHADALVLRASRAFELAQPWTDRRPEL